jgi:formylglycine-generating enzyme required for sulfatase activity
MPRVNDQIGPYQLIKKLGRGGFGEVWLAKNVMALVAGEVALKIPHDDKVDILAIKQEASIWLAASGHTNVLRFIEANVYDDYVVFVSEYAPDGSLRDWLEKHGGRAPSIEAGLAMTCGILDGLVHLHQPRMIDGRMKHIIHRDLKPDNVLLQGAKPLITDFGISRLYDATSQSAVIAGTIAYMAPEAFDGKRNEKTDIWSVGVMLYQMLAGRLPFIGQTNWDVEKAIRMQEPHPLPAAMPDVVQKIIAKALTKNPDARYQSASAMLSDLQAKLRPTVPDFGFEPERISPLKFYVENLNGVTLEMVLVPGGRFLMGSDKEKEKQPIHEVHLPSFYLGRFQVTQKQWQAVISEDRSYFKGDDLPVESVSWPDAQAFCEKLRAMTGKAYRLPSEAEWEYACRAGTTGDFAGNLDEMGWYANNSGHAVIDALAILKEDSGRFWEQIEKNRNQTHPVGRKNPNTFGLYDMHANVWEWCEDVWHENYDSAPNDGSAWTIGENQGLRVVRGGAWCSVDIGCRSAHRYAYDPFTRDNYIGFRVVVSASSLH